MKRSSLEKLAPTNHCATSGFVKENDAAVAFPSESCQGITMNFRLVPPASRQ
jgi:hypothetical protein